MPTQSWANIVSNVTSIWPLLALIVLVLGTVAVYAMRRPSPNAKLSPRAQLEAIRDVNGRPDVKDFLVHDRATVFKDYGRRLSAYWQGRKQLAQWAICAAVATIVVLMLFATLSITAPRPTGSGNASADSSSPASEAIVELKPVAERNAELEQARERTQRSEAARAANRQRKQQHEKEMADWKRQDEANEAAYKAALAKYEDDVAKQRLAVIHRDRGARGDNKNVANAPYNFALDVPKGTKLYFEVSPPAATAYMRRDKSFGSDPMILDNIKDGKIVTTDWNPSNSFYMKQNSVYHADITVWLNNKPARPERVRHPMPTAPVYESELELSDSAPVR